MKWVYCISLNDRVVGIRTSVLGGVRGFCTENAAPDDPKLAFRGPRVLYQAQAALMEYLNSTAGLEFYDAEHLSKHSPVYLDKVLSKVEKEKEEIGRAIARFLRYHPPNEFELLFESMGLKPSEFSSFLPRDLIYLKDDATLLDNYHVLYNYGIDRGKIGRFYVEATDIFKYKWGVLKLKLQAYEQLGLSKAGVIKIVTTTPTLLIGDVNREFVNTLKELEDVGIQRDWMEGALSEKVFYNWGRMSIVLRSCLRMGFAKQELRTLIRKHPDFLLDGSGGTVLLLIGFLLKAGKTRKDIFSLLTQFPQIQVGRFVKNLRLGLQFLVDLEMDPEDIKMILSTHTEMLGRHTLKKAHSVVSLLQTGSRKLREMIKEDPSQLNKYVKGIKLCPLPSTRDEDEEMCRTRKREFLLRLGFLENSKEMQRALRDFRGKGDELQERYDFLIKSGLEPKDVYNMINRAPNVLNQKIDILERKINFLINDLGFPMSSLAEFPKTLAYTIERVKLRVLMYNWLKDKGKVSPSLSLSSILACSDEKFKKWLVSSHPQGPKMWEKLKAEF